MFPRNHIDVKYSLRVQPGHAKNANLDWPGVSFSEGRQGGAFAMCHRYDSQLHWLPGSKGAAL